MPDANILALTAASTPLSGSEIIYLAQGGADRRCTADDVAPTLRAEVVAARDGEASLADKLAAIEASIPSGGGGDEFFGWPSGAYFSQALVADAMSTVFGATNRLEVMPWRPHRSITLSQISIYCTNTGAAAFRLCVYASDANGLPGSLIWASADTTPSSTGEIAFFPAGGLTFTAGTTYWLGWHTETSGAGTHRACAIGSVPSLGLTGISASQGCQVLRTTSEVFSAGQPSTFPSVDASMLTQSTTPLAFLFKAP